METIPGVRVPKVYPELSTSKILTMEFVRGVKVSNVERIQAAGLDTEVVARNTYRAILKQILIDGFFHADPHPGNILVNLDTGNVTFIDIGMVGELDLQAAHEHRPIDVGRPAGRCHEHGPDHARSERPVHAERRRPGLL